MRKVIVSSQPSSIVHRTIATLVLVVFAGFLAQGDDADGAIRFITQWGEKSADEGQFHSPIGIAISEEDVIYVTDVNNARLQKFNTDGNYLGDFELPHDSPKRKGSQAAGIVVGSDALIYLPFMMQHKIRVYTDAGELVRQWGKRGTGTGEFHEPGGLALGDRNVVYVADQSNHRVQVFTTDGKFLKSWGGIRTPVKEAGKTGVPSQGGAESGAVGAESGPIDADLQVIIRRWPDLPEHVRAGILAMVPAS